MQPERDPVRSGAIRVTSGLRIRTPVTLRGMRVPEMRRLSALIDETLSAVGDASVAARVRAEVSGLCEAFLLPR